MCGGEDLSEKQGLAVNTFFDVRGERGSDSCRTGDSFGSIAEVFHWRQFRGRVFVESGVRRWPGSCFQKLAD